MRATSTRAVRTRSPDESISFATAARPASSRSQSATRAPSAARRRAHAAPMPDAAPVTRATLLSKRPLTSASRDSRCFRAPASDTKWRHMEARPLRIGILGAATIAPMAIIRPARQVPEAEVVGVAARDPERAARFAKRHGVPRVHATYDALLADPELDAIYNPLPNGLHCEWTLRALAAGKHVLCEKPLASNEEEAQRMAEAADRA